VISLADAYLAAVRSMEGSTPDLLEPTAVFIGTKRTTPDPTLSLASLCEYLQEAPADHPLRMALHLAVAGWDADTTGTWHEGSAAHTPERRQMVYRSLGLDDASATVLSTLFPETSSGSVVISDEFEPWYSAERRKGRNFYWRAYKNHLLTTGWDPDAVTRLDTATTEVVERLSDPLRQQAFQAKGLVVGYVQSGKTANFTGVVAKAIDAGYRLVIVLTGTIDLLRKQTQRRLDMELVGVENIFLGVDPDNPEQAKDFDYFQDADRLAGKFLKHGFQPSEQGFTDIVRLTHYGSDYRSLNNGITALELQKRDRQRPLFDRENLYACDARLAIVKKNGSVLRKLVRDLKRIRTHLGEIPTLIIDDESDQASVNTSNPKKWQEDQIERTAINRLLSELLTLLPRAQYVGYTATPYANVFIDPSDAEDIFPKDFLISLERPEGYMGVGDFHDLEFTLSAGDSEDDPVERTVANSNELAYVRDLNANRDDPAVSTELLGALDSFVLSGAIKLFRATTDPAKFRFKHHTMLAHQSVKMADHRELADLIHSVWRRGGYQTASAGARLELLLEEDFRPVNEARAPDLPFPATYEVLKPFVGSAVQRILENDGNPVLVVNGDKDIDQQNLDFETCEIWRILVGGAKLSRGFTVEGLTTSYYKRKTKLGDTLMQMGRWFGFRRGYNDLVRLYIGRKEPDGKKTIDLYKAFEAIVRDEEAFRSQLRRYSQLVEGIPQITPRDIPPLVSQHLPTIKPSAPNKMFNAELVLLRSPGEMVEPTAYPLDPSDIKANYDQMLPLLERASDEQVLSSPRAFDDPAIGTRFRAFVGVVDAATVLQALTGLRWLRQGYFDPNLAYIREITGTGVVDWAVIAPQLRDSSTDLPDLGLRSAFLRHRRDDRDGLFGGLSDPKHRPPGMRIAGAIDGWGDVHVEALVTPRRGGILIYPTVEGAKRGRGDIVMAFSIFAPQTARPANGEVVQFRARYKKNPKQPIVDATEV
jgi:hypothetical protein